MGFVRTIEGMDIDTHNSFTGEDFLKLLAKYGVKDPNVSFGKDKENHYCVSVGDNVWQVYYFEHGNPQFCKTVLCN